MEAICDILNLCGKDKDQRPTSEELLKKIADCCVSREMVTSDDQYQANLDKLNGEGLPLFVDYWKYHKENSK